MPGYNEILSERNFLVDHDRNISWLRLTWNFGHKLLDEPVVNWAVKTVVSLIHVPPPSRSTPAAYAALKPNKIKTTS